MLRPQGVPLLTKKAVVDKMYVARIKWALYETSHFKLKELEAVYEREHRNSRSLYGPNHPEYTFSCMSGCSTALSKFSSDPVPVSHLLFISKKISSGSRCINKLPARYRNALIAIQAELYQAWIQVEEDEDTRLAVELMVAQCYT